MPHPLLKRKYWIFDMDGTLTLAKHDFVAMRTELGLRADQTILESLAQMPSAEAAPIYAKLQTLELDIAQQSEPAPYAPELLEYLKANHMHYGILTRNSLVNVEVTLKAAGMHEFFTPELILSRDCAPPKPHPAGIERLLKDWNGTPEHAVMVGDFKYDLEAGRAAKTATLYIDPTGEFPYQDHADYSVRSLQELLA